MLSRGIYLLLEISGRPVFRSAEAFERERYLKIIRGDRVLSWAVVGNTYLWFLAALLQFTIVIYGHDVLHVDEAHISLLQAAVLFLAKVTQIARLQRRKGEGEMNPSCIVNLPRKISLTIAGMRCGPAARKAGRHWEKMFDCAPRVLMAKNSSRPRISSS